MPIQNEDTVRIRKAALAPETAQPFVEYALLAAVVYNAAGDEAKAKQKDLEFLQAQGWQPCQGLSPRQPLPREIGGLQYEVWENTQKDPVEVALVFRGTDEKIDWWSNLRWVTSRIPFLNFNDQYVQVQTMTRPLVAQIRDQHPTAHIVTVGHSLGGGLAHQAAYESEFIKEVFAFNSSPVTGFYGVPTSRRVENVKGMKIYRIFEHGEILAFVRIPVRFFNPLSPKDPESSEYRFNLTQMEDAIKQHGMRKLAYNLKRKAENLAAGQPVHLAPTAITKSP